MRHPHGTKITMPKEQDLARTPPTHPVKDASTTGKPGRAIQTTMCSKRASDGRRPNVKGRSCFHVCKQTKKLRNLLQKRGTEVHPIDRYDYLNMRKDHRYHRHLPRNTSSKTSEKPRGNHWRHVGTSLQHQNPPSTYRLKNRDLSHRTSRGNSASHTIQLQRLQHWNSGVRNQNRTTITQNPPNPAKTGLPFFSRATKIGRKHHNPERETTIFALWDALTAKRRMGVEEGFRRAMAEARAGVLRWAAPAVFCNERARRGR